MLSLPFVIDTSRIESFQNKIDKKAYAKVIERAKKHGYVPVSLIDISKRHS